MEIPDPPAKMNKKALYAWLNIIREAVQTYRGIEGRNMHITDDAGGSGQVYDAEDCPPCP